jgi:hypothetical protein
LSTSSTAIVGHVVAELRRYVLAHPHAADGLNGVARWWLPPHLAQTALRNDVQEALEELVAQGLIERRELPDGSILFGARRP